MSYIYIYIYIYSYIYIYNIKQLTSPPLGRYLHINKQQTQFRCFFAQRCDGTAVFFKCYFIYHDTTVTHHNVTSQFITLTSHVHIVVRRRTKRSSAIIAIVQLCEETTEWRTNRPITFGQNRSLNVVSRIYRNYMASDWSIDHISVPNLSVTKNIITRIIV